MKKILVTGAAGYIGSVLVRQLLEKGYFVRGLDILNFGGESLISIYNHPQFQFFRGDIRKIDDIKKGIDCIDAVFHLAAIVGDPACAKQTELAKETNWESSKLLFDICKSSNQIKKFIFASTCSNYGKMLNTEYVDESSLLKPISLYAELKVKFETYLLESNHRENFCPISLRFATAYGLSSRIRFDLTVNEFIKDAVLKGEIIIYGEQFWRPYCHVNDLARACISVLETNEEKVSHQVFGVGDTKENYQKKMIAEEILKVMPTINIKYVHKNEDPRDYRVDFSKIKSTLGFKITKTVPMGIREIYSILKDGLLLNPNSINYSNS